MWCVGVSCSVHGCVRHAVWVCCVNFLCVSVLECVQLIINDANKKMVLECQQEVSIQKTRQCLYCHKKLPLQTSMKRHILTHTWKKIQQCGYCHKKFARRYTLKQHILTHTGEKSHQCDYCQKRFTQRSFLNRHIRTLQAREKPCTTMWKRRFTKHIDLQCPRLTHTGLTTISPAIISHIHKYSLSLSSLYISPHTSLYYHFLHPLLLRITIINTYSTGADTEVREGGGGSQGKWMHIPPKYLYGFSCNYWLSENSITLMSMR